MTDQPWQDGSWESADGLSLHYRDYPGDAARPAILCLPGLTRNARDFEPVAEGFAGKHRVICAEFRGRGESDYSKEPATYIPAQYVADMLAFFDQVQPGRVVVLGTSLGGIVATLLAAQTPEHFAAIGINDIGPVIDPAGLARIRDQVGQGRSYPTWMHAARALRESMGMIYPDFTISEWLRLTKRLMVLGQSGRIAYDYDMRIAEPFDEAGDDPAGDLWPAFRALPPVPKLVLRGELSDILSTATLGEMEREIDGLEAVTIARTGHTPTLDEAESQAAIARLLERAG
ncbi:alpha/beta fold hydrolase [Alteraurantiacibacter aquimixticola]|uniref:Alpha/beta hydrolase n=1 Tax=Alteraurantiacibacter aquimixticola TaxID=2489173 RepID=A0A4T3F6Q6_9SPHN|nr:alpha/beta hydrolase [Alteraurantiacibacter aquimixticola]TIX50546.1 alpha/beta hydrolase [Alteraurantiacibacter aquimixticola]